MTKTLSIVVTLVALLSAVAGAFIYLDDKYYTVSAAEDLQEKIELESVRTFQAQQQVLDTKIKESEYKRDVDRLEFLRTQKILLEKRQEDTPSDLIEERLERIIDKIDKLEAKLVD